ncbi:hypothetical protein [uncultured Thiodictyon sp.]|uniref:hypothetical protein n=1 Tax=uncultured Thiodictyon sp. TaxID=1846217 RepID=UPI0025F115AF|nr:hypothetical protein [uncultured Thiodictyon sp.]
MSNYRRALIPGGTYFFTLVTWHRQPLLAGEERIGHLRESFRRWSALSCGVVTDL